MNTSQNNVVCLVSSNFTFYMLLSFLFIYFSLSGWHCFLWAVVTGIPSWCHYWYGCVHQKTIDSNLWLGQISQNMELWSMVRHFMVTVHFIKMKLINNLWQFKVSLHYALPKNPRTWSAIPNFAWFMFWEYLGSEIHFLTMHSKFDWNHISLLH